MVSVEWREIPDFPGYSISDDGRVRNDKRENYVKAVKMGRGHLGVALVREDGRYTRSIARLVCQTFLPPALPHFDTPIFLNGELDDCCVENLAWRPRWFALKHTRQFRLGLGDTSPVRNIHTHEEFESVWFPVVKDGLLWFDVVKSITNLTTVFPTMHRFEWLK